MGVDLKDWAVVFSRIVLTLMEVVMSRSTSRALMEVDNLGPSLTCPANILSG